MIREKRKKKSRWKLILLAILSLMLVVVISALLVVKVFVVKTVKVEGNVLYDEALIKSTVLNDVYSWNSLYVLLKYTFLNTEQLPFIDTMEIQMENPQTLKIKVYEKGMMGYLYIPAIGQNAYFDKDGFVIETSKRIIDGIPQIEGLTCNEVVLYEKLPIADETLKEILTLTQTLKNEDLMPEDLNLSDVVPNKIVYGVKNEPVLVFGEIKVQLGSIKNLTEKVERMWPILPRLKEKAGTLHLENWTGPMTNIVFEEAE